MDAYEAGGRARTARCAGLSIAAALIALTYVLLFAETGGVEREPDRTGRTRADGDAATDATPAAALAAGPGSRSAVADAARPVGDGGEVEARGRIAGVIARPGWARVVDTHVEVSGLDAEGASVRRRVIIPAGDDTFEIGGLPAGTFAVSATAEHQERRARGEHLPVELRGGGARDDVVLLLVEFVVEGLVVAGDGAPLAGLPIQVDWWAAPQPAYADVDGRSVQERLSARIETGEARIRGLQAAIRYLEELSGDAEERSSRLREVEARAAAIREGLREARAMARSLPLVQRDTGEARGSGADAEPGDRESLAVRTDGAGRFVAWLPGPGEGVVIAPASGPDWMPAEPWLRQGRALFTLTESEPVARTELVLPRTGAIAGTATAPPREGDQVLNVWAGEIGGGSDSHFAGTRRSGAYRLEGLRPGRWVVRAHGGGEHANLFLARAVVDVRAGAAAALDLSLGPASSLSGIVTDAAGAPLAGRTVVVRDSDLASLVRTSTTDETGTFTLLGVYPGPYRVEVEGHSLARAVQVDVPEGGGHADAGTLTLVP